MRFRRLIDSILAAILLLAAVLKGYGFHGPPAGPRIVLVDAELILAIWLLIGGFEIARFICAISCFALFAIISSYEAFRAMPSCGCFGNVKVPPAITAGFDITAVIAMWLTRKSVTNDPLSRRRVFAGAAIAGILSIALWAAYFLRPASAEAAATGGVIVLEPDAWIGKPFPFFEEIEGGDALKAGRWLVVIYHYDCEDCQEAIPNYLAFTKQFTSPRVAFVAMPPLAPAGQDPATDSADYLHLSLRQDHDWFATTPVTLALQEGRVVAAAEGEKADHPLDVMQWR